MLRFFTTILMLVAKNISLFCKIEPKNFACGVYGKHSFQIRRKIKVFLFFVFCFCCFFFSFFFLIIVPLKKGLEGAYH